MDAQDYIGQRVLVTDFDGTLTRYDFFDRAYRSLPTGSMPDYWGEYERGELSHFEALRRIFADLPYTRDEMCGIAASTELDPALPESLERLREAGWQVIVASAGCAWYIGWLLDRAGVELPLLANPGEPHPVRGLTMHRPTGTPYASEAVGVDKLGLVRALLQVAEEVAYAGDGRPDEPALKLMRPERRFATGWAAQSLTQQGMPFVPFDRWSQVADRLCDAAVSLRR